MNNSKLCVVTGASGGIGSEIAIALNGLGYKVILQGRNVRKLEKLQHLLGNDASYVTGDLGNAEQRTNIFNQIFEKGTPHLLVNAAGISAFKAFEAHSDEQIEALVSINLIAPMLFTKGFLKRASYNNARQACTIVNVGSAFGYIGYPGFSAYNASKFGLRGFTESLSREYADSAFTFKYFAPRATKTEINSSEVERMNAKLGNKVDSPEFVAQQFIAFLQSNSREQVVGWPEKLFARVNALFPSVVDKAITGKLTSIKQFLKA